ncbi:MAG TPA: TIGR03435 family protein [Vicinamibacterales bacterium]|nr:TIGR03435 family protein [Vicinamibacterales bacterium]
MRRWLVLFLVAASALLRGQAPEQKPVAFEVASVKLNNSGTTRSLGGPSRGHFIQSGTLRQLIQAAYRRGGFEIRRVAGGPAWMDSDHYDIDATVDGSLSLAALYLPDGKGSAGLAYLMLRSLLADRFKLVVHTETQQLSIYALTVVKRDNTFGPQLHKSDVDCDAVLAEIARTGRPVPPAAPGQMPPCSTQTGPGHIAANAISMSQFAEMLSQFAERETHDQTSLRGNFDVTLDWSDDLSVFTAMQEQLGLKLEPSSGPVDVIVIDHVERPTPD